LVARELTSAEIAAELCISEHATKTHVAKQMRGTGEGPFAIGFDCTLTRAVHNRPSAKARTCPYGDELVCASVSLPGEHRNFRNRGVGPRVNTRREQAAYVPLSRPPHAGESGHTYRIP